MGTDQQSSYELWRGDKTNVRKEDFFKSFETLMSYKQQGDPS